MSQIFARTRLFVSLFFGIVFVCKPLYRVTVQFSQRDFGFQSITHLYRHVFGLGLEYSRYKTLSCHFGSSQGRTTYQKMVYRITWRKPMEIMLSMILRFIHCECQWFIYAKTQLWTARNDGSQRISEPSPPFVFSLVIGRRRRPLLMS